MMQRWRHRRKIQFVALLSVLLAITNFPRQPGNAHPENWMAGDIIFLNGNSLRSKFVRLLQGYSTDYSHVGVVVIENGIPFVVNADPVKDRVVKQRWDTIVFSGEFTGGAVYRLDHVDLSVIEAACVTAENYDNEAIPFDHNFDLRTGDKLFCTELVWRTYLSAGIDLCKDAVKEHPHLLPADLYQSPALKQVLCF